MLHAAQLIDAQPQAYRYAQAQTITVPESPSPAQQLRILLIEDEREVREMLARLLRMHGYTVACAGDGAEALSLFRPGAYDVICSDLSLPDTDGWALFRQMRAHDSQLTTILLSGWSAQIDPPTARSRGADYLVAKPIELDRLYSALREVAQKQH